MSGDFSDNYTASKSAYIFLGNKNKVVKFKPFLENLDYSRKSKKSENKLFYTAVKMTDGSELEVKLSFKVLAGSRTESVENHKKFSKLVRMIMPLKTSDGIDGGAKINVCQLYVKFCNLIHNESPNAYNSYTFEQLQTEGLLCNISSIQYKPETEMGFFEGGGGLFAKAFTIDLNLMVVKGNEIFQKVSKIERSKRNRPGNMFGFEIKYDLYD